MTVSQKRVPRGVSPSGVSLVSISASPGVEGVVARDTVIIDDFVRRRADILDAEAAYYRPPGHPTAAGPGPWLLRRPAPGNGYRPGRDGPADTYPERSNVKSVPRDPARRCRRQPLSQFPDRNRGQLIDIRIDTDATTMAASASPGRPNTTNQSPDRCVRYRMGAVVTSTTGQGSGGN
jgi:hypothetical protein